LRAEQAIAASTINTIDAMHKAGVKLVWEPLEIGAPLSSSTFSFDPPIAQTPHSWNWTSTLLSQSNPDRQQPARSKSTARQRRSSP